MYNWKESKGKGVYTIRFINTRKLYVGSTTRTFYKRWADHLSALRIKKHANIHLQRAFNKYGENSIIFEILEECEEEFILSTEQFWLNMLDVYKIGYNRNPTAYNSKGVKRSKKTCENIGKTGNWRKANEAWVGNKHTEETRKLISNKVRTHDKEYGRVFTEERKANIGKALKKAHAEGRISATNGNRKYKEIIAKKGDEVLYFKNTTEAKEHFNLRYTGPIGRVLKGERKHYKGYTFEYRRTVGQVKPSELLENPEEDNQQPSQDGNI